MLERDNSNDRKISLIVPWKSVNDKPQERRDLSVDSFYKQLATPSGDPGPFLEEIVSIGNQIQICGTKLLRMRALDPLTMKERVFETVFPVFYPVLGEYVVRITLGISQNSASAALEIRDNSLVNHEFRTGRDGPDRILPPKYFGIVGVAYPTSDDRNAYADSVNLARHAAECMRRWGGPVRKTLL